MRKRVERAQRCHGLRDLAFAEIEGNAEDSGHPPRGADVPTIPAAEVEDPVSWPQLEAFRLDGQHLQCPSGRPVNECVVRRILRGVR